MSQSGETGEMTFLCHLEELRWRIIKIIIAIALCAVPCGVFWKKIFTLVMMYPLEFADPKPHLIITSPVESVMISIKIALGGGILLAAPAVFYQMWRFVSPGLFPKERRIVLPAAAASTIAFLSGIGFCYLLLPFLLRVLTGYAGGLLDPYFTINGYFDFLLKLSLAFGLVFELPVVSFVLVKMRLLTPAFLTRHSRVAVIIIFLIAAVLTPPDVFSQLTLAVPLLLLYALSIIVARIAGRSA
ncbi:MAG: twin-arginine translocase subunit TatC [Chitinispirillaceae bacterium]|nr:twin-arginine translocase subunit TatC [Chitinispirillaceae bacterium]